MAKMFTRSEFETVMSEYPYLVEELREYWFGEEKALYLSIEGDSEAAIGYDVLEELVREREPNCVKDSTVGEECYRLFTLSPEDVASLWNVPALEAVKEKTFVLVEVVIPGMYDYIEDWLFY